MRGAIITVATMKGGTGKSTVASCLAVHWHLAGWNPVLIDADPQRSIVRTAERERALGGLAVVEDDAADAAQARSRLVPGGGPAIIDTPGFRSATTLAYLRLADFVLIPIKPSPLDVDRMLDMIDLLPQGRDGRVPLVRCVLTQTTRDTLIARYVRSELAEAGIEVLRGELTNRVAYPEAAMWGATPSLIERNGPAAREIEAVAEEIEFALGDRQAAA